MYLNQVKENKLLRKYVQQQKLKKYQKPVFNNWDQIDKKLIDGQWWVKSKDALK